MKITQQTADFIAAHADDDVRQLALKTGGAEGVDFPFALNQISCMQTARKKLPSWYGAGIIYPPALSMEQCSSEQTAAYKAQLASRLAGNVADVAARSVGTVRFADITGGFGVDFFFISRAIGGVNGSGCTYVESQQVLCECAENNFPLLQLPEAEVICADGTQYIRDADGQFTLVYLDPARRDIQGRRTYGIRDCTPDAVALMPTLLAKSANVMIKLSPMLDWRKAVADLGGKVSEVHIVSVANECKELLFVMSRASGDNPLRIYCVNDTSIFEFSEASFAKQPPVATSFSGFSQSTVIKSDGEKHPYASPRSGGYLYEPNASIMKAGCFDVLSSAYGISQVSANSHLYFSASPIPGFPGRAFRVESLTTMNKKELRSALAGITKANITVRNFPLAVADLRKRLKLKDGGDKYIFATTLSDSTHCLVFCVKE